MRHRFEELVKEAKKVTLTKEEKALIEARLVSFMKIMPVRNPAIGRQYYERSNLSSIIQRIKEMPIITVATMLALMLGGGTAFAAQGSLPGDALYPVKTGINEKVMELTTFSTQGKAQLEAQLATERLQEAEQLSAKGKLTRSIQSGVQSNFEQHANSESDLVNQLQAQGNLEAAAEINSEFESKLSAHQNILSVLNVNPLSADAQAQVDNSHSAGANIDQKIAAQSTTTVSVAAQARLTAVTDVVNTTNQLLNANENSIKATFFVQAQAQVNNANSAIASAKVKIAGGAYGDAFTLLQQAQQLAEEVNTIVRDKNELNIGVGTHDNASVDNQQGNEAKTGLTSSSTSSNSGSADTETATSTTATTTQTNKMNDNEGVQLNSNGLLNVQSQEGASGSASSKTSGGTDEGSSGGAKGVTNLNIGL